MRKCCKETASIKDAEHAQKYKEWEEATKKAEQAIIAYYKAERLDRPELREKLFDLFLKSDLRDSCGGHVGWIDGIIDRLLALIPDKDAEIKSIFEEIEKAIRKSLAGENKAQYRAMLLYRLQALKSRFGGK